MTLPGNSFLHFALDAVFPRFCVSCGAEGGLFCTFCAMTWSHEPPEPSNGHVAFFAYANPVVRKLICAWKYDYDLSAFVLLAEQAEEYVEEFRCAVEDLKLEGVVPMPLSGKRFRERGFNQSRMLAKWMAQKLDVPVLPILGRDHRAGHQAERTVEERERAMEDNPFVLCNLGKAPRAVLLVDDVWTTGATMNAAKRVLQGGGETSVSCFTLAKG